MKKGSDFYNNPLPLPQDFGGFWIRKLKNIPDIGDGPGFSCELLREGKPVATFVTDMHGGCDHLSWHTRELENKHAKDMLGAAKAVLGDEFKFELENVLVRHLAGEYDYLRMVKRHCKNKVVLIKPDSERGTLLSVPVQPTPWNILRVQRANQPCVILNNLIKGR